MPLEPPFWWYGDRIPPAAWALWPVSAAYGAVVERRFRTAVPYVSSLPVICVGNFTVGGAGKTPIALKLASMLREAGLNPGFLTRGYGGSERGPYVIDAEADTADRVGDEPLLLARSGTTVVSRDRPAGAQLLETLGKVRLFDQRFETPHPSPLPRKLALASLRLLSVRIRKRMRMGEGVRSRPLPSRSLSLRERDRVRGCAVGEARNSCSGVDAIVMDDGFQNPSLNKDFSLVVVDAGTGTGVGCGQVFPLGPLRAPLGFQLAKADAVVILGAQDPGGIEERLTEESRQRGHALAVFKAGIVPVVADEVRERGFLAFCGIGRPDKFFGTAREAGIAVVKSRRFPDHHVYTEADARSLLAEAKALNAGLLTTEKDAARLKGAGGALGDLYRSASALPVTVAFSGGGEARLLASLLERIGAAGSPKRSLDPLSL